MKEVKATALAAWKFDAVNPEIQGVGSPFKFGTGLDNFKTDNSNDEKMERRWQNTGIKALCIILFLVTASLGAFAQKSVALDAFSKHGIDADMLNADNLQPPDDYAFDFTQTTITSAKQTVLVAKFDPAKPKDERWTVVSVDGKSPSKSDINTFRKNQEKQASKQADDASYRVEKDASDYLVISYKPDPASIAMDMAFMKDCRLYMTINLQTKKLEQVQVINEKPVKIKILNAQKFDFVTKYSRSDDGKRYFPVSQNLDIQAKFLGQAVNVQTISEYSNYSRK